MARGVADTRIWTVFHVWDGVRRCDIGRAPLGWTSAHRFSRQGSKMPCTAQVNHNSHGRVYLKALSGITISGYLTHSSEKRQYDNADA